MSGPLAVQLNIVAGSPREEGPFTRTYVLRQEGPAYLFALAEPAALADIELCPPALDRLLLAFSEGTLSPSGRLAEAMRRLHQWLAVERQRGLVSPTARLGVLCAYLRDNDLYLVSAGPAVAYVISRGRAHQLAGASASGPSTSSGQSPPLGGEKTPQLVVRHHVLRPGELVLLATSQLDHALADRDLAHAFHKQMEAGMVAVYRGAKDIQCLGVLALDPQLPAPADAAEEPEPKSASATLDAEGAEDDAGLPETPYSYWRPGATAARPAPSKSTGPQPIPAEALLQVLGRDVSIDLRPPKTRLLNPLAILLPRRLLLLAAATAISLLLVLGAAAMARQWDEAAQQKRTALLDQATHQLAQAEGAAGGGQRRLALAEAMAALEALQVHDPQAAAPLLAQARAGLAALDAVFRLTDLHLVADLQNALGGAMLARGVVSRGGVSYVLDKGGDRVVQVTASTQQGDGPRPSVQLLPQGASRRNLEQMVWFPRGGPWTRDSLFVLDEDRTLLEVGLRQDPSSVALRSAPDWESTQAMAASGGSLYLLDPKAGQLWRYPATLRGFDGDRRSALASPELRDAVDVEVDGDIFVLLRTGKLLKAGGGAIETMSLDGLDRPLLNPSALCLPTGGDKLYLLDLGNQRVVVAARSDGRFLRQFPLGDLPAVRDLWVDEERGALLLLSDTRLYTASLPKE